jgi:hypothetical protein
MIKIAESANRLDILSPMTRGYRLLFVFLALIPLLAPYELILRVQWTDYLNPFFLFAAVISAGAVALSGFFIFAAVAGLSSRMTFDAAASTFTYTEHAPVIPRRTRVFPLNSIESVDVHIHEWSDSGPSFSLMIRMSDGATFHSASSWSRKDIEHSKILVQNFIDRLRI